MALSSYFEPSLGLKKSLLTSGPQLCSTENCLPYQNWSYWTDDWEFWPSVVGTGLVCRRDQALKENAGISELSATANGSLAQGTVPERVGEESMPWPSQASRHQDGAPDVERERWVPRIREHQGGGVSELVRKGTWGGEMYRFQGKG